MTLPMCTLPLQSGSVRLMLIHDTNTGTIVDADVFFGGGVAAIARSALAAGLDGEFRDYPAPRSALPSPSDHAEMPKRMIGRRLVRTCSCGKPWPCDQSRWNRLRDHITGERAAQDQIAADHGELGHRDQEERAYGRVEALDGLLATMERMEAGQ